MIGTVVGAILSGCAWTSDLDLTLYEGPEGTVFLERFPAGSAPASHPVSLEESLVARMLEGVRVQEQPHMLEQLITGTPEPAPAFRDGDIAFLSPLLVEALALAAPDQRVGFRLARTDPSPAIDQGRIYVENSRLHLLLSRKPRQQGGLGRSMDVWTVSFTPEAAMQTPNSPKSSSHIRRIDGREAKILVIDHTRLARSPKPDPSDVSGEPPISSVDAGARQKKEVPGPPEGTDPSLTNELEAVEERLQEKSLEIKALEERVRKLQGQIEGGGARSEVPETNTRSGE